MERFDNGNICGFPKKGGPQNDLFRRENPILVDDLVVTPFQEPATWQSWFQSKSITRHP